MITGVTPKHAVGDGPVPSPLILSHGFGLGIDEPLRRAQIIQNLCGGPLDRRGGVGESLLVAIVERDVIGARVGGLKTNSPAYRKGDGPCLGFSNDFRQRRSRFIVVHHLVSEFMHQNREFLGGWYVRHEADTPAVRFRQACVTGPFGSRTGADRGQSLTYFASRESISSPTP